MIRYFLVAEIDDEDPGRRDLEALKGELQEWLTYVPADSGHPSGLQVRELSVTEVAGDLYHFTFTATPLEGEDLYDEGLVRA
jgi:hypothetical protein